MADESNPTLPKHYENRYRTAVEWRETDLAKVKADWAASVVTYIDTLKAAFGSERAVVPNSAGAIGPDGFTVENSHIVAKGAGGLFWVLAQVAAQKKRWEASPTKFGKAPIVITWGYPDKIPGVYLGNGAP